MPKLPKRLLLAFVLTALAGAALHALYALLPSLVTALFSPVSESLWEHVKIVFWPYLAAMLLLTRGGEPGTRTPWLLTAPLLCAGMLALGWLYHIVLGGEAMWPDIAIYAAVMAAGFLLPGLLRRTREGLLWGDLGLALTVGTAGLILLFTFLPPEHLLFQDLSAARTWATIPV